MSNRVLTTKILRAVFSDPAFIEAAERVIHDAAFPVYLVVEPEDRGLIAETAVAALAAELVG